MATHFSQTIKKLRRGRDLTQEQVAETFGVSPQAVSRWETGATYPDIELLPHIAIFFGTTVDALLGTEVILGQEHAVSYIRDIRNLLNAGKTDEALARARRAAKEYPTNIDLQYLLLQALCTVCSDETPGIKAEILSMGERVVNAAAPCPELKFLLIRRYAQWGMRDKAKAIVESLPTEAYYTQDLTMHYVLEGAELQGNQRLGIIRFTIMLCDFILGYGEGGDVARKIACHEAAMQIQSLTNGIVGNDSGEHTDGAFAGINLAELYCEAGEGQKALHHIETAVQHALHHIEEMDKPRDHDGGNYYPWPTPRNLCWILWEDYLAKAQFDRVRGEARFTACLATLKANSQALK